MSEEFKNERQVIDVKQELRQVVKFEYIYSMSEI